MPHSPNPRDSDFLSQTASFLPGALVLCLASLVSGGLGALIAVRLLYVDRAPSLWYMLRVVFSKATGG